MKQLILLIGIFALVSCSEEKRIYFEDRGEIFHTVYSIKYEYSRSLKSEIESELMRFDDSLNPFKPTSIISKVNNNEGVALDTLFVNVFEKAQEVSQVSEGLFDITISPLINAWGFGFKNTDTVTSKVIDSLKQIVGYKKIAIKKGFVIKEDPRMQINTSAIAKGYSTDIIAHLLDRYGIKNYMIEVGGEVRAQGTNQKNKCWSVGIDKPEDEILFEREFQAIIQLCDKSIATSGNYRNFYIKDGKKYAHTIDPRTGYPSDNNVLSATVIADNCMTADAYATVFMLADTARTRAIAQKQNLSYMLILGAGDDSYITVASSDFQKYIIE